MKAYLRQRKNSQYYHCVLQWNENGTPQRKEVSTRISIKGNNKRRAEKKCEEIRKEYEEKIEKMGLSSIKASEIMFDDYMLMWLEEQKHHIKQTTYYGYEQVCNNHIIPYFKPLSVPLLELTPILLQAYYNQKLDDGLSANTVRKHHANIRKALQRALEQNFIPYNVADRTTLPSIEKFRANTYNDQQIKTLLDVSKGTPMESVIVLCSFYGLRRGEVCGLRWSDINFEEKIIKIENTRTTAKEEVFQNSAKNQSSVRDLPMNEYTYNYLMELKNKQMQNKEYIGNGYDDSNFVCCWDDGKPLKVSYVSHAFSKILSDNNLPHIRLHDLRHSCATNLLKKKVDLKIIQDYLGHSTISTTANFYLHPDIEQKREAVNALSDVIAI